MTKPIIGIVGRLLIDENNIESTGVFESYRKSVIKCGGIPITIMPPIDTNYFNKRSIEVKRLTDEDKKDLIKVINLCDGILMPGGNQWYEYDEFITNYVIENNIPVLGICMGFQLLAAMDASPELILKANDSDINHKQRGIKYAHTIKIEDNTILKNMLNIDKLDVNSEHNVHISKTNKFKATAFSDDGYIEALELENNKFTIGVQWHPDKSIDYDASAKIIFEKFIESGKNK